MPGGTNERRRGRRVQLQAPLLLRRMGTDEVEPFTKHMTENIGLAGIYFYTDAERGLSMNDVVMASVSIPDAQRRNFPFTRVTGRSRVVRVDRIHQRNPDSPKRVGVALEFGSDMTVLTTTPSRA